eukprot:scaffold181177_cov54-Attheya_sp.AAC.1
MGSPVFALFSFPVRTSSPCVSVCSVFPPDLFNSCFNCSEIIEFWMRCTFWNSTIDDRRISISNLWAACVAEIETLNHQHHLDYVRSIVDPDLDVDSEFFQVLAVTNHMIRHKNTPDEM